MQGQVMKAPAPRRMAGRARSGGAVRRPLRSVPREAAVCYQDTSGRILERRTPGAREVPCPAAGDAAPPGTRRRHRRPQHRARPVRRTLPAAVDRRAPTANDVHARHRLAHPSSAHVDDYVASVPVPDRWRIVDTLGYKDRWYDPYNRNILKGDKPISEGGDWFFNLGIISDSVVESRAGGDAFRRRHHRRPGHQWLLQRRRPARPSRRPSPPSSCCYQGDTVFMPPVWEFRLIPAFNINYAQPRRELGNVNVDPRDGKTRTDSHIGLQGAFIDKHLYDVSDNYDFDSMRVGIQPFSSDFRGFLFQDNQLGIRWFGNARQQPLPVQHGLLPPPREGHQQRPERPGRTAAQGRHRGRQHLPPGHLRTRLHRARHAALQPQHRGWRELLRQERPDPAPRLAGPRVAARLRRALRRPRAAMATSAAWNLTTSMYAASPARKNRACSSMHRWTSGPASLRRGAVASTSTGCGRAYRCSMPAATRIRSMMCPPASMPVLENPQFAGADTSYWIRQAVPLVGGGKVALLRPQWRAEQPASVKDERSRTS